MSFSGGLRFFRDAGYRADGLELFFDLVFVLCVANLTRLVREDTSWEALVRFLVLFVPIWWAWIGVTFYLDRFPADDNITRLLILIAAAGAGVMALAIPAITARQQVEFAFGYALARITLALLYLRARRVSPAGGILARRYAITFAIVATLWLISVLMPESIRAFAWALAMAIDILAPTVAGRDGKMLPVDSEHLPSRMGSFVIIVIGESMVTTAALTDKIDASNSIILVEGFLLAVALWWGFYDRGAWRRRYEALSTNASGRLAMVVCAYLHFPLVVGIAAAAAGVQNVLRHRAQAIGLGTAIALSAGCALYLLSMNIMAAVLRTGAGESLIVPRLVLIMALVVIADLGTTQRWPSGAFLAWVVLVQLTHLALNLGRALFSHHGERANGTIRH